MGECTILKCVYLSMKVLMLYFTKWEGESLKSIWKEVSFFSPFFLKLILYFFRFCSSIHIWVHNSWHISVLSRLEKAQLYIRCSVPKCEWHSMCYSWLLSLKHSLWDFMAKRRPCQNIGTILKVSLQKKLVKRFVKRRDGLVLYRREKSQIIYYLSTVLKWMF